MCRVVENGFSIGTDAPAFSAVHRSVVLHGLVLIPAAFRVATFASFPPLESSLPPPDPTPFDFSRLLLISPMCRRQKNGRTHRGVERSLKHSL